MFFTIGMESTKVLNVEPANQRFFSFYIKLSLHKHLLQQDLFKQFTFFYLNIYLLNHFVDGG